jgi:hypothetical protein
MGGRPRGSLQHHETVGQPPWGQRRAAQRAWHRRHPRFRCEPRKAGRQSAAKLQGMFFEGVVAVRDLVSFLDGEGRQKALPLAKKRQYLVQGDASSAAEVSIPLEFVVF